MSSHGLEKPTVIFRSKDSGAGAGFLERTSTDPVATLAQLQESSVYFGSVLGISVT